MKASPPVVAWAVTLALLGAVVAAAMLSEPPAQPEQPVLTLLLPQRPPAPPAPAPSGSGPSESKPAPATPDSPNESAAAAPAPTAEVPLAAVDPALTEDSIYGPLPAIGPLGRKPWQVYGRPFVGSDRPRIAVIVTGIGLSATSSRSAMETLPADVTFAVLSYADDAAAWVRQIRSDGHEALLAVPMQPETRTDDPGPRALTVAAGEANLDLLEWHLARAGAYVGLVSHMGGAFLAAEPAVRALAGPLRDRGLIAIDASAGTASTLPRVADAMGVPFASIDRIVDTEPSRTAIDRSLAEVEDIARSRGAALAFAHPYPVTIEALAAWAEGLKSRGFDLAPVTALLTLPAEAAAGNGAGRASEVRR